MSAPSWGPVQVAAAIITTMMDVEDEMPGTATITGTMYAAMMERGIDIHTFTAACELLLRADMVKRAGTHQLLLTEHGMDAARKIDAVFKRSSKSSDPKTDG